MAPPQPLSAGYLRRRYLIDGLTTQAIAGETGWSSQYVRDRLRDHGIPLRPRGATKLRPLTPEQLRAWLDAGQSIADIARRSGYSTSGVHKMATQHQLAIPERIRPPLASQRFLDQLARDYLAGDSLAALAERHSRSTDWVRLRLVDAGITIRQGARPPKVAPQLVRDALDEGLRTPQIAQRLDCSEWTIHEIMRRHGWTGPPRRPRGPTRSLPPVPTEPELRALYVDQGLTIKQVSQQTGISTTRINGALQQYGITRRKPGWTDGTPPPPITAEQLQDLYVDQDLTIVDTATKLDTTTTRVRAALQRHGMTMRPERRPKPPVPLDVDELTELYVTQHLDDSAIGARLGMPAFRVRQRREELGVRRPPAAPPRKPLTDAPPAAELAALYTDQGLTLAQIARRFETSSPRVRQWLDAAAIPVKPRTTRETRTQLDPAKIRELYQDRQWSSPEIAAHLGISTNQVLRVLHEHDIPVRIGPSKRTPDPDSARLTALYNDPDVRDLLRRHRIPRRKITGGIAERFPQPHPVTYQLLVDAYLTIGLSAAHIEQITGTSAETIYIALHAHNIAVRPLGVDSPWYARQKAAQAR